MSDLNSQQQQAVNHIDGPLLVIAGAGSGKTRIVTMRIVHLLQLGVPASEILAVTFTNKAAEEMRHRIHTLSRASVLTCTFHSLCARILRESITALGYRPNFIIFDEDDSEKLVKECLVALNEKEDKSQIRRLSGQISHAKNNLREPSAYKEEDPLLFKAYELYQTKLKEYNALDFDDLLFLTVKLFRESSDVLAIYQKRWRFILIDEYQDTNAAQYSLIKLLAMTHHNVFAVGDPDQSIYSWRGANIENILNFERDYPGAKTLSLEQNYRSTNTILQAANALIKHNEKRFEKNLWSTIGSGEKIGLYICENERAEADFVVGKLLKHRKEGMALKECVIFYRTHFQSRTFEDALLRQHIPYVIVGGLSFYQRREIKDILSLMRMVLGSSDFLSFARTLNTPKRGFGEAAIDKLRAFAEVQGTDVFSACVAIVEKKKEFKLSKKQEEGLAEYVHLILSLQNRMNAMPLHELFAEAIERSRYLEYLKEDPDTFEERRDNLQEIVAKAAEWEKEIDTPSLALFLEDLSLKSNADDKNYEQDSVRLMTLHNGKGLEFALVFLVGLEEDLFPHLNSKDDPAALEEERRLCYVGMTRAKQQLYLTAARLRFLWGTQKLMRPSRFLKEIPTEYLLSQNVSLSHAEDTEETHSFEPGDTVFHKDFGVGLVNKTYQSSLGLTYEVFFPQANTHRTLIAKYAKLKAH